MQKFGHPVTLQSFIAEALLSPETLVEVLRAVYPVFSGNKDLFGFIKIRSFQTIFYFKFGVGSPKLTPKLYLVPRDNQCIKITQLKVMPVQLPKPEPWCHRDVIMMTSQKHCFL